MKVLAENRKARHNYIIEDTLECGISLLGTEVKSMKANKFSFNDAYAAVKDGELWLAGLHISEYKFGNQFNHDPDRRRKLLVHANEIIQLRRKTDEKGLTLVPIKFYLKNGIIKLELGICKGKKLHDKRHAIKAKDIKRETDRILKNKY